MKIRSLTIAILLLALSPLGAQCPSCGKPTEEPVSNPPGPVMVKRATNKKCPVMGEVVSAKISPYVRVGNRHYFICCAKCAETLSARPGDYLAKDGHPLNEDDTQSANNHSKDVEEPAHRH